MSDLCVPIETTKVAAVEVAGALTRAWQRYFGSAPAHRSIMVLLAQWALETGRGASCRNYNIGNIKASVDVMHAYGYCTECIPESVYHRWCSEPGRNIKLLRNNAGTCVVACYPPDKACRFRAYPNVDEGAFDYLKLLVSRFEKSWPSVLTGDAKGFVYALKAQGYFTSDVESYASAVQSLFSEYVNSIEDKAQQVEAAGTLYEVSVGLGIARDAYLDECRKVRDMEPG